MTWFRWLSYKKGKGIWKRIFMFWDRVARVYDLFENVYNGKVNKQLCIAVADMIDLNDHVLECACGTGMLSKYIAGKSRKLIATDYSVGMLKQAKKKCKELNNIEFEQSDIMQLKYEDNTFDKVVAGNVIHLLDAPYMALKELERVCCHGGQIIIPTYINNENTGKPNLFVRTIEKTGAGFKCQFTYKTYQQFFEKAGYTSIKYSIIEGKMPCAIAVITKS